MAYCEVPGLFCGECPAASFSHGSLVSCCTWWWDTTNTWIMQSWATYSHASGHPLDCAFPFPLLDAIGILAVSC